MIACNIVKYNKQTNDITAFIPDNSDVAQAASEFGRILSEKFQFSQDLIDDAVKEFTESKKEQIENSNIKPSSIRKRIKYEFDLKTKEKPSEKYIDLLHKFYDSNMIEFRNQQLRIEMFNNFYMNIGDDFRGKLYERIVHNSESLNKHIENQFNIWFKDLIDFYGAQDVDNPNYYNKSHNKTELASILLNRMYQDLEDPDVKKRIENGYYDSIKEEDTQNAKFFKAVNSYLSLVYFDDIIQSLFNNTINITNQINPVRKVSTEEGTEYQYKYSFNQEEVSEANAHSWNDKDVNIDILAQMGGRVRAALEVLPVFDYMNGQRLPISTRITKALFMQSITMMMDIVNNANFVKEGLDEIKNILDNFPKDQDGLKKVLNYLFNNREDGNRFLKYLKDNGITDQQLNILFSVRRGLYGSKDNGHSYEAIENSYERNFGVTNRSKITDAILAYINNSVKMRYTETNTVFDKKTKTYNFRFREIKETENEGGLFDTVANVNGAVVRNNTGTESQRLKNKYPYKVDKDSIIVDIKGFDKVLQLELSFENEDIFTVKSSNFLNRLKVKNTGEKVSKYFDYELNQLRESSGIESLLSEDLFMENFELTLNKNLSDESKQQILNSERNKYRQFINLLNFLNDLIKYNIDTDRKGLQFLSTLLGDPSLGAREGRGNCFNQIVLTGMKALCLVDLYSEMNLNQNYRQTKNLVKYLQEVKTWHGLTLNRDDDSISKNTTSSIGETNYNLVSSGYDDWVRSYQYADDISSSSFDKSTITDPAGNKQAKYSTIYIGAKYRYRIKEIKSNVEDVCRNLLFVTNQDAIRGCYTDTYITIAQEPKAIQDLTESELYTHNTFDLFFSTLIHEDGVVFIQPCNVADKKKIPIYKIDMSKIQIQVNKALSVSLSELRNPDEMKIVNRTLYETLRSYYNNVLTNVANKYSKLLEVSGLASIQTALLDYDTNEKFYDLIKKAQAAGITLIENVDYVKHKSSEKNKIILELNPLLLYYTQIQLVDYATFEKELNKQKVKFVENLVKSGTKYNVNNKKLNLDAAIRYVVGKDGYKGFKKDWVDEYGDLIELKGTELNPLLNYYFSVNTLLQNNLRLMMFDSEISHTVKKYPNKSLSYDILTQPATSIDMKQINSISKEAIVMANKRAGQLSSTVNPLKQNQLNGMSFEINIAFYDDLEAPVYTLDILKEAQKVHDGGGWITGITKILEDNSLHENKAGTVRKPMLAWHNPQSGSSTQVKFAVNTLTNRFMRQSLGCDFDGFRLFKKMLHTIPFAENGIAEVNLVSDGFYNGRKADLTGQLFQDLILQNKNVYYWKINPQTGEIEYRKIVDFGFDGENYYTKEYITDSDGDYDYDSEEETTVWRFDDNGNYSETNGTHTISTLFELYQAMGGINSLEYTGNELADSELSQELVANFLNNIGTFEGDQITEYNQNGVKQVLKSKIIHYFLPKSAGKDGVGNINPTTTLFDESALTRMTVHSTHLGIQNDSDHESDESTMKTPSQVINIADVGGTLHAENEMFYEAMARVIRLFGRQEESALRDFLQTGNRNSLYKFLTSVLVDEFDADKQKGGIGQNIINVIKKELDKYDDQNLAKIHFPFSDHNVFSILVNSLTSKVNNNAIRNTFPGGGMPLAPSYGIRQIYEIDGLTYQFDDFVKLIKNSPVIMQQLYSDQERAQKYAGLQSHQLIKELVKDYLRFVRKPELEKEGKLDIKSQEEISPSEVIDVYYGTQLVKEGLQLNDLNIYYSFMSDPISYLTNQGYLNSTQIDRSQLLYKRNITSPRDLAPDKALIRYKDKNVDKLINLYNTTITKLKFRVSEAQDEIELQNLISEYNSYSKFKNYEEDPNYKDFSERKYFFMKYMQYQYDLMIRNIEQKNEYNDGNNIYRVTDKIIINHEGLFSNIYQGKFGLSVNSSLSDVLKQGPIRFSKRYDGQSNGINHVLRFKNLFSDDNEVLINFSKSSINNPDYFEKKWNDLKEQSITLHSDLVNSSKRKLLYQKVYYKEDYEKKFLVGIQVINKDIRLENGKYIRKNKNGQDEALYDTKRLSTVIINGKQYVIEYVPFVTNYRVLSEGLGHVLYNINYGNIDEYKTYIGSSTQYIVGKILSDMYSSGSYGTVYVNNEINPDIVPNMSAFLNNFHTLLNGDTLLKDYLSTIATEFDNLSTRITDRKFKNNKLKLSENGFSIYELTNQYYDKLSNQIYSSFQKSLDFIVLRIPSQTLQSFMLMRNVGFTNSPNNECYVSHIQLFLQGSDYDYDKGYTLGYTISDSGRFVGWSNLFDYSSIESLNKSMELPLPLRNVKTDVVNKLFNEINTLKINMYLEKLNQDINNPINYLPALLKEIEFSKLTQIEIPSALQNAEKIKELLDSHYTSFNVSSKVKESMLLNFIVHHISKVITHLPNLQRAHNEVKMKALRDGIDTQTEISDDQDTNWLNPNTPLRAQIENMSGKKGTGIAANGEKGAFMWSYYARQKFAHGSTSPLFSFYAGRIVDRRKWTTKGISDKTLKNFEIQMLSDLGLDYLNPQVSNEYLRKLQSKQNLSDFDLNWARQINPKLAAEKLVLALKDKAKKYGLDGRYKPDDLISQILSAATDNAKELILKKLNGNTDLLKCHLLLFSLGIDVEDVIRFMTSAAVTWLSKVVGGNIYNGTRTSLKQAIRLVNPKNNLYEDQFDDFDSQPFDDFDEEGTSNYYVPAEPKAPTSEELKAMGTNLQNFKADIEQFETVLNAANEFTNFTRLLRMNQGIPGKDSQEFIKYLDSIKRMVYTQQRTKGSKEVENARSLVLSEKSNNFEALRNKGINITFSRKEFVFDIDLWLNDRDYQEIIGAYYEKIKSVVNIFDAILTIPHYRSMFGLLNAVKVIIEQNCTRFRFYKKIYDDLTSQGYTINDRINTAISKYIDDKLIINFLSKSKLVIPMEKEIEVFNHHWNKKELGQDKFTIDTALSAANFKYLFETVIFPNLKEGKYMDFENGKVVWKENKYNELRNNKFVQSVIDDTSKGERIPYKKLNIDTINSSQKFYTDEWLARMKELKDAFYDLQNIRFGEVLPFLGRQMNVADLFVLYNLIYNKNRYGENTFTKAFEDTVEDPNSLIYKYFVQLGELESEFIEDFSELDYSLLDIKYSIAEKVKKLNKRLNKPVVYIDSVDKRIYYEKDKITGKYKRLGEPITYFGDNKIEKLERMIKYGVLSSNISEFFGTFRKHLILSEMFNDNVKDDIKEEYKQEAIKTLSDWIYYNKLAISINCQ